LIILPPKRLWH